MAANSIRAFSDPDYDYYELTRDLHPLEKGTIFYHDKNDGVYGSITQGCLKNCWTPDGNCYGGLCGGTVIFHYCFANTDLFKKVTRNNQNLISSLSPGTYTLKVYGNDQWIIERHGS